MRIVETDNFGGDYPDEKFVNLPVMSEEACEAVCKIVNDSTGTHSSRYYMTVPNDYILKPGFEP